VPAFNNCQGPSTICEAERTLVIECKLCVEAQSEEGNPPHSHPHPSTNYEISNRDPQPSSPKTGASCPPQDLFHYHFCPVSTTHAATPIPRHTKFPAIWLPRYNLLLVLWPSDNRPAALCSYKHPSSGWEPCLSLLCTRLDSRCNSRIVRGKGRCKVCFLCKGLRCMLGEEGRVNGLWLDAIDV